MPRMINSALLHIALLAIAANSALAQGSAGSYGRVTNQCSYYLNNSLLYKFGCRVMYSGEVKPARISFIDNYKSNERYLVGRGQPVINSEVYGFKYAGGKCITNTDTNIKVCW